jgi:hypothetical protein
MQHDFDASRWSILLEANYSVDGATETRDELADGLVGALLQARREVGMVPVKHDLHVPPGLALRTPYCLQRYRSRRVDHPVEMARGLLRSTFPRKGFRKATRGIAELLD